MNLESRKEKKRYFNERTSYFIVIATLFVLSNRSRPSGDQTSTFSRPGHFLIATGDRATAKF